jgi:cellulose biosynthesis protein BcsQ
MPNHVISVVNNKGGTGKTTSSISLAHALANQGKKVLLVDVDSQCNSTSTLLGGVNGDVTLYQILSDENASVEQAIHLTDYRHLSLLPNIPETAALEPDLLRRDDRGYPLLQERLRPYVLEHYDFTLLDCPPNLGMFSMTAMIASDSIIVPVEAGSRYSTDGLTKTVGLINSIQEHFNPDLRFLRLLINKVDMRTNASKNSVAILREVFGEKVFETYISNNTDVQQAEIESQSVLRYNSKATASLQFRKLAKELISILDD